MGKQLPAQGRGGIGSVRQREGVTPLSQDTEQFASTFLTWKFPTPRTDVTPEKKSILLQLCR